MKLNFKYSKEKLLELKNITDKLKQLENNQIDELSEELLKQLTSNFINGFRFPNFYADSLFEESYIGACGCLGPRDGNLYCYCEMNKLQYEYRYDIALNILELQEKEPVLKDYLMMDKQAKERLLDLMYEFSVYK